MNDQRTAFALYSECFDPTEYNRIHRAVCNRVGWGIKHAREVAAICCDIQDACFEQSGIEGKVGRTRKALLWAYWSLPYDKYLIVKQYILSFSNTNEFDCPDVYSGRW